MLNKRIMYHLLTVIFAIDAISDLLLYPLARTTAIFETLVASIEVDPAVHLYFTLFSGLFSLLSAYGMYTRKEWISMLLLWGLPVFPILSLIAAGSLSLAPFTPLLFVWAWFLFRTQIYNHSGEGEEQQEEESSSVISEIFTDEPTAEVSEQTSSNRAPSGLTGRKVGGVVLMFLSGYSLLNGISIFASITGLNAEALISSVFSFLFSAGFAYAGNRLLGMEKWRTNTGLMLLVVGFVGVFFAISVYSIAGTESADQINEMVGPIINGRYGLMLGLFFLFILSVGFPLYRADRGGIEEP